MFTLLLLFVSCQRDADLSNSEPSATIQTEDADISTPLQRLSSGLGMDVIIRADAAPVYGPILPYEGYTVRPVSIQIAEDFRVSAALWEPTDVSQKLGAIVAHGHFGEGKSSGEAQGVAHSLAMAGYVVLAIDTPGVEEGDRPNRQIHFDEGAENRSALEAAGSSAMALQLHGLMAGIDLLLTREDVEKIVATGASGGAVQVGYLALIDNRVDAVVMASYVPTPRSITAGGCLCDNVPGFLEPDGELLQGLTVPNLWISELSPSDTSGVGPEGTAITIEGEHGYSIDMINAALIWLNTIFQTDRTTTITTLPNTPSNLLQSTSVGASGIVDILAP